MSHRIKLTFFCVSLAVVAGVVTYGVLTWDIQEPLRIQAVSYERNEGAPMPGRAELGTLWLEIENTSHAPVLVYEISLSRVPNVFHVEFDDSLSNEWNYVELRSHHAIRAKIPNWEPRGAPLSGFEDVTGFYIYVSKTQSYWARFCGWLNDHVLRKWNISEVEVLLPAAETKLLPASSNSSALPSSE